MLSSIADSKLTRLYRHRKVLLSVIALMIVCQALLAFTLYTIKSQQTVILIPPTEDSTFQIHANDASESYIAEMTEFFSTLALNLSPENAKYHRNILLRHVHTKYYGEVKKLLIQNEDKLIADNMNTVFYPVDVAVEKNRSRAIISGDLAAFIGKEQVFMNRKRYQLTYQIQHGRFLIIDFSEIADAA